jgi:DNA-directed RNA polymerase specialized sigma24 family protein
MTTGVAVSAGESREEPRASALMREHGVVLARVCMALLGDAGATERALERVAREAGAATFEEGKSALPRLMGMARVACANQLSKLPVRNTAAWGAEDTNPATLRDRDREPALARASIGRLKPTEREALVLHLVGGLDALQVSEACGIDLETARQRIARGVAQLVQEEKRR